MNKLNFDLPHEIDIGDIIEEIVQQLDSDQVVEFIKKLEDSVGHLDVTEALARHFFSEMEQHTMHYESDWKKWSKKQIKKRGE